jgi:hypothetical protein
VHNYAPFFAGFDSSLKGPFSYYREKITKIARIFRSRRCARHLADSIPAKKTVCDYLQVKG